LVSFCADDRLNSQLLLKTPFGGNTQNMLQELVEGDRRSATFQVLFEIRFIVVLCMLAVKSRVTT
jgi:hypothetical protein